VSAAQRSYGSGEKTSVTAQLSGDAQIVWSSEPGYCPNSRLETFGVPDDFPHRHVETFANPLQGGELQILFPVLECSVIGPVHLDLIRESFLREVLCFAMLANHQANAGLEWGAGSHGVKVKGRLLENRPLFR
jgi:hypothetical protein